MITTIETRLRLDTTQEHNVNACVEAWSTAYHQTWRLFNNHHQTEKQIYDVLMVSDAFTSYQAKSLINKVTTEHSKIKALTKYQLTQKETKLKHINAFIQKESKAIEALENKVITLKKAKRIKYAKIAEHVRDINVKTEVIEAKKKKATRLEKGIKVLQCRIDTNTFKLCFGSTALLKQHPKHPSENHRTTKDQKVYATVDEWKADWTLARQNIWYAVGDRSKPQGNAEIQYDPVSSSLRLRLTETAYRDRLKAIALEKMAICIMRLEFQ